MPDKRPAVFLDRDGTIIQDRGYISDIKDVVFYPDTFRVLGELQKRYLLFVITNQSGIGRGIITREQAEGINRWIDGRLKEEGISIREWW